jgi:hypothetical protein
MILKPGTGSILLTTAKRATQEPGTGSIIYKMKKSGTDSILVIKTLHEIPEPGTGSITSALNHQKIQTKIVRQNRLQTFLKTQDTHP